VSAVNGEFRILVASASISPLLASTSMQDTKEKKYSEEPFVNEVSDDDDRELVALGYKPSFKREFTNLATVCVSSI
jgi:hypothetical protein